MVLFGNVTVNGTVYTGDKTDEIMNYFCGGTIVVFMLVGLLVNSNLIIHLKLQRPSWIDKFLFYLSWFRLFHIISDGIRLSYMVFNKLPPTQIAEPKLWIKTFGFVSLLSYTVIFAIDGTIVVIQCCNVHFPSWSLLTGSYSKMTKRVTIAVVTFLSLGVIASTVYGNLNNYTNTVNIPLPGPYKVKKVIASSPALITGISMLSIFAYTWIRFWHQTGAIHISSTIKREFKLVALLVAFDTIATLSNIFFLVNLTTFRRSNIRQSVYIWVFSSSMVPLSGNVIVTCCILVIVKEGKLWRGVTGCCQGLHMFQVN